MSEQDIASSAKPKVRRKQPVAKSRVGSAPKPAKPSVGVAYGASPVFSRSGMLTFDSGRPFWIQIPILMWVFVRLCFLPFVLIKAIVETALSIVMLAIFLGIGAWAFGFVENPEVAAFLNDLGDRSLELLRLMGLPY